MKKVMMVVAVMLLMAGSALATTPEEWQKIRKESWTLAMAGKVDEAVTMLRQIKSGDENYPAAQLALLRVTWTTKYDVTKEVLAAILATGTKASQFQALGYLASMKTQDSLAYAEKLCLGYSDVPFSYNKGGIVFTDARMFTYLRGAYFKCMTNSAAMGKDRKTKVIEAIVLSVPVSTDTSSFLSQVKSEQEKLK